MKLGAVSKLSIKFVWELMYKSASQVIQMKVAGPVMLEKKNVSQLIQKKETISSKDHQYRYV